MCCYRNNLHCCARIRVDSASHIGEFIVDVTVSYMNNPGKANLDL